jgi:hypothetical protein
MADARHFRSRPDPAPGPRGSSAARIAAHATSIAGSTSSSADTVRRSRTTSTGSMLSTQVGDPAPP